MVLQRGLGLTSRTFGMGADWVKSIEMVSSNGDLVTATTDNEFSDLFCATLGGVVILELLQKFLNVVNSQI